MCTDIQLRLKRNITDLVIPPANPGIFTGTTNVLKSTHKAALKLYETYKEHKRNTIKAIQACFDEGLLIDLEFDGILVGYTPIEIYKHILDNFLLPVGKDWEILKAKELLKTESNPDRIVQYYYKAINPKLLLTALREEVTDNKVKCNVYSTFEKHIDFKEACQNETDQQQHHGPK